MSLAVYQYLDTNGDGTGTKQATGNYASTPTTFKFTGTAKRTYLNRMIVYLEDSGNFSTENYGAGLAALTNGIEVLLYDSAGTEVDDLTGGIAIKSNGGWARVCHDVSYIEFGAGDNVLSVRWTFANSGKPLLLPRGGELRVALSDDCSGFVEHTFMVQGWEEN